MSDSASHKEYTILVITRCSRPQQLLKMLDSLNRVFKDSCFNFTWYVAVDANIVPKVEFDKYSKISAEDKSNKVIIKHVVHSKQFTHGSDLLNIALFDPEIIYADFVYTLDDDNIIHPQFLHVISQNIQTDFDMLLIDAQNYIHPRNLDINCTTKVDTANMLFNFNTFRSIGGYISHHMSMNNRWKQDGLTCSRFIQFNKKLVYANKIGAHYNYLRR